ncbi:GntR family transcriptional regulator [Nocardioides sp. CCNWLW239]|uniref:GntR family transcriptional regulator n=1 Tax=Nocardioides sp. CCNWLW239 TaxID=3128902 RepID=UPI0030192E31
MRITVDPDSGTPPYEQIRQHIDDLITTGSLATGHRLPSVRQLAGDLGLAPGTVARAYRELEQGGLVQTRRGAGTRVIGSNRPAADPLLAKARTYVASARALGCDDAQIKDAIERALTDSSRSRG